MQIQILSARPFVSSSVHQDWADNTEEPVVEIQIVSSQLFNYDKIGGCCMKRAAIPQCSADKDVAYIDKIKLDSLLHCISLLEHRNKNQNVDVL